MRRQWLDPYRVMDFPPDPDVLAALDRRGRYEGDGILVRDLYSAATVSAPGNLLAVIEVRDRDPFRLWYSYAAEDRDEMLLVAARCVAAWRAGAVVEFPKRRSRVAVKGLESYGVRLEVHTWTWPLPTMPPAKCDRYVCDPAPSRSCFCGYHAAYSIEELVRGGYCTAGVLIVVPLGRTVWHSNAWRAESYATLAAVVPLSWERPDGWDPDVPVEWARYPVYRAREIQLLLQAEE